MPSALLVRGAATHDATLRVLLDTMASEVTAQRVGAATVLTRLADVVITRVIRMWVEARGEDATGWLAAIRDPKIGRALRRFMTTGSASQACMTSSWNVGVHQHIRGGHFSPIPLAFVTGASSRYCAFLRFGTAFPSWSSSTCRSRSQTCRSNTGADSHATRCLPAQPLASSQHAAYRAPSAPHCARSMRPRCKAR